jgi:hypothetical protein
LKTLCSILLLVGMLGCGKPKPKTAKTVELYTNGGYCIYGEDCVFGDIKISPDCPLNDFCATTQAVVIHEGKIAAYWSDGWKTADGKPYEVKP